MSFSNGKRAAKRNPSSNIPVLLVSIITLAIQGWHTDEGSYPAPSFCRRLRVPTLIEISPLLNQYFEPALDIEPFEHLIKRAEILLSNEQRRFEICTVHAPGFVACIPGIFELRASYKISKYS
jgi:hypothetical protein